MRLSETQSSYLEKRRRLLKSWRYVGPVLLLGIIGLAAFLYVNSPLLVNPYEVLSRFESGSVERSTLEMMALLLPIMFILVGFLLIVIVAIMYAAFSNENRYMDIVRQLRNDTTGTQR